MSSVLLDISMSLDGFIAGPNDDVERLHEWIFNGRKQVERGSAVFAPETERDAEILTANLDQVGAVVMGRHTYDLADEPWGDEPPFGVPVFVVTHRPRDPDIRGETTFTFVSDGIESAFRQAHSAADGRNISVMGAHVGRQFIEAGLLDEVSIHIVPVLLGAGTRLFEDLQRGKVELEQAEVIQSRSVTHMRYCIPRQGNRG